MTVIDKKFCIWIGEIHFSQDNRPTPAICVVCVLEVLSDVDVSIIALLPQNGLTRRFIRYVIIIIYYYVYLCFHCRVARARTATLFVKLIHLVGMFIIIIIFIF